MGYLNSCPLFALIAAIITAMTANGTSAISIRMPTSTRMRTTLTIAYMITLIMKIESLFAMGVYEARLFPFQKPDQERAQNAPKGDSNIASKGGEVAERRRAANIFGKLGST